MTNSEFDAQYEKIAPSDRVLFEIYLALWKLYSDNREYRLSGNDALGPEGRALFERCALFLATQRQYDWPFPPRLLERVYSFLKGFGGGATGSPLVASAEGEREVWPFFRRVDYEEAQSRSPVSG